jgi:2-oxoglutarate ferredoxin oxidoreductase subunit beta
MSTKNPVSNGSHEKIDFSSDQDVRWCPGCGDYAILAQMKKVLPSLGIPREKFVIISGIGCSSRFPYYMNTYGFHTIHGRAPAVATGVKLANPELSIWIITGDGDALSIGGNHLIHLCRRNLDVNLVLFNNQIYGLTKGQYSPTSPLGKVTKTTPYGSLDQPFNPISLVLSAGATFVARTIDRDTKHMAEIFEQAAHHKGLSFVEVYQNCNIFNDGAYALLTDPKTKQDHVMYLEHGQPLIYGQTQKYAFRNSGFGLERVAYDDEIPENIVFHDAHSPNEAYSHALARLSEDSMMPTPVGVFRDIERPVYNEEFIKQMDMVKAKKGKGDLKQLLLSGDTWKVD